MGSREGEGARNRHRSGYQTAILAELADRVFSIERIAPSRPARKILDALNYYNVAIRVATDLWMAREPL